MIDCKDIDYVLAIAHSKSLTEAARKLYISQPALSKYLHSLEKRLNLTLFNRAKNALSPTVAGAQYIARAEEISSLITQLNDEMEQISNANITSLRVAFSNNGIKNYLVNAIALLNKNEPDIQTDCQELTSDDIELHLLDRKLDIGFITLPSKHTQLRTELLFKDRILLCVPSSNSLCSMKKETSGKFFPWIDLSLFDEQPFILRNIGTRFRALTDTLFEQVAVAPIIIATTRNHSTTMELAEAHNAAFFLPESFIHDIRNPNNYSIFTVGSPPQYVPLGYASVNGEPLSPSAQQLIRILKTIIANRERRFRQT